MRHLTQPKDTTARPQKAVEEDIRAAENVQRMGCAVRTIAEARGLPPDGSDEIDRLFSCGAWRHRYFIHDVYLPGQHTRFGKSDLPGPAT
jgi:hypothetical protein